MIDKSFRIFGYTFTPISSDHIRNTESFISSYGDRAYTYGRILPVFRNFMPFVAGMMNIKRWKFMIYNMIGAIVLILIMIGLGRGFGSIPGMQQYISLLMRIFV